MKIKRLPPDWRIERPLRSFLRAAVIISLLFCLATAFADVPNHWVFLVAGLGYSLFLAFVSIGICILPHRTRARVFALMFGVQTCCLLVGAAIFAVAYYAHRLPSLPTSSVVFPLVLVLAVLVVFASRGWYLHITRAVDRNA